MKVEAIGEFGLIERIIRNLPLRPSEIVVDIGDDAVVIDAGAEDYLVATCDIQVEDVHFRWSTTDPFSLGRRALAINISDVGAMGGWPSYALVSLGLPGSMEVDVIDRIYSGMVSMGQAFGVAIVGGNVSRSSHTFIDVTLLGFVRPGSVVTRSGARPGDKLLVTGTLGDAYGGLMLLEKAPDRSKDFSPLVQAHRDPLPRQREGRALAEAGLATSMIDISDGLAGDLKHLGDASGVGACVWLHAIPLSSALREASSILGEDPLRWALHGGEDYELLFTVPPGSEDTAMALLEQLSGVRCTVIGEILPKDSGIWAETGDGRRFPLDAYGHDHFRREAQ